MKGAENSLLFSSAARCRRYFVALGIICLTSLPLHAQYRESRIVELDAQTRARTRINPNGVAQNKPPPPNTEAPPFKRGLGNPVGVGMKPPYFKIYDVLGITVYLFEEL